MSKIQEALRRIQSEKPKAGRVPATQQSGSDAARIAALSREESALIRRPPFSSNEHIVRVDRQALREAGLLAPEYHVNLLATQYRNIKRPSIRHAFGKRATKIEDGNLIMVTSAVAGEGKTFTSINLALSMAQERDHSVILVDADVAKPHVSDIFGVSDEPGLLDLIEDSSLDIHSVILPTDVEGLNLLPAGAPRPHATELLASSRMEQITRLLSTITHEPIVIFDSPPLLQTSESGVVASLVGQIVMVVRADSTSHELLKMALNSVGPDRAVNLVLNQVRESASEYQYGYGYGYNRREGKGASEQEQVTLEDTGDDQEERET